MHKQTYYQCLLRFNDKAGTYLDGFLNAMRWTHVLGIVYVRQKHGID